MLVEFARVGLSHGSQRLLHNVSFGLGEGEALIVRGPSGCGKTTLLRLIANLEIPDNGERWFGGRDYSRANPQVGSIGFAFQDVRLFPHLTVLENVTYGLHGQGLARNDQRTQGRELLEALAVLHLEARSPRDLSGGEAMRVGIARAIAPKPRVILLDEPTAALDDENAVRTLGLVLQWAKNTKAALVIAAHHAVGLPNAPELKL